MTGDLDVLWNHGRAGEPKIQVHAYDESTVILRQSKTVTYEAPFLFLLFGDDRALLLDTGATGDPGSFPLRETVDRRRSRSTTPDGLPADRRHRAAGPPVRVRLPGLCVHSGQAGGVHRE
jgi:hypothetical protein